ncbi:MAG: hydrogenase maturation nickel metallochaperone HypA/HybF [Planctomycetota bacterium]
MHETMVAESLLATISAEAAKQNAKQNAKPVNARISCGMLNAINDEVLCFAFEAITKGTPCEGIKLEIEHKPMQGRCKNCNQSFDVEFRCPRCPKCDSEDFGCPRCPKCDSEDFDLLPDAPLLLEQIEFQTEQ